MSLSDLASVGSLVSGIAVLVSLIYLGLQTHQAVRHTKALILQGRSERIVNHHLAIAASDLVAAWITGNGGNPTPEEIKRRQFLLQGMAYDFSWEDTFGQHEAGLLGHEQFADFRAHLVVILRDPGLRKYFQKRPIPKDGPTKFQRFLDEVLAESAYSLEAS